MATNPFGIDQYGKLVLAADVARGLACNCKCPSCSERLVANKGKSRSAYFSHDAGTDCGRGIESAMHLLAKEIVLEAGQLAIPSLTVRSCSTMREIPPLVKSIIPVRSKIKVSDVELECPIQSMIADCLVTSVGGKRLIVEIKVTHAVDDIKKAKLEEAKISAVEYDFGSLYRKLTSNRHKPLNLNELKDKLRPPLIDKYLNPKRGHGCAAWLYHKDESAIKTRLDAEYEQKVLDYEQKEASLKKMYDRLSGETGRREDSYRRAKGGD